VCTANQFVEDADPDAAAFRDYGAELISVVRWRASRRRAGRAYVLAETAAGQLIATDGRFRGALG